MVKLKNVAISRAFSDTDLHKKENFKEPQGMVDIDLENGIFNMFQLDRKNYDKSKHKTKIGLPFFIIVCIILGGLVSFLLTIVLLNNFSIIEWYNENNSTSKNNLQASIYLREKNDSLIGNTSYSLCNLNRKKREVNLKKNISTNFQDKIIRASKLGKNIHLEHNLTSSFDSYGNDSRRLPAYDYNYGQNSKSNGIDDMNGELNPINDPNSSNTLNENNYSPNNQLNAINFYDSISNLFNVNRYNRNVTNLYTKESDSQTLNQNKNNSPGICPTYNSPLGYPILQQQVSPYIYNSNQAYLQSGQLPPQFSYSQTFSQTPFYYGNSLIQSNYKNNVKTVNGKTYICHPVAVFSENSIDNSSENVTTTETILQQPLLVDNTNKTRASRSCPVGEVSCEDNSKCIKVHQRCDGEVHCKDVSDEAFCPCKTRLSKSRVCDGYIDCPNGEDESQCFGCELGTFSCDDWSPRERVSTCIPIEQRCDGVVQCPTETDELDCSRLIDTFSSQHIEVSKAIGFLYKNFQGRWYPACHNTELWANEACRSEIGPNTIAPLVHLVPITSNYNGFYASGTESEVKIVESCKDDVAVFVECPPLVCGIRVKEHNPFRREEVDTSAERILGQTLEVEKPTQVNQNDSDPILGNGRVVGGRPSQPKAWPWIVSVYRNGVFHCGGALISEYWIVSAAHCVDKYWHYYFEIQAGVLRRYSYAPMVQNRIVSNIVAHQFYDKRKLKNDIALMKISKPVEFNRYVRPICLPSETTAGKNFIWGPEPGTLCTAVGWGAMVEHGTDPDHLREVQVPVHKKCKHQEDEEGKEICAGLREGGKDACQGDSGGPFMCRNPNVPNQWYLAGIVSHGEGCARPNEPGVYTRVSLFLEWIYEHSRADILSTRKPLQHCPGYICKESSTCLANKRRCDKIVDCLQGDDEIGCERNSFNEIFKHAMRRMFLRNKQADDESNLTQNKTLMALSNKADILELNSKNVFDLENSSTQTTSTTFLVFDENVTTKFIETELLSTNTIEQTTVSSLISNTLGVNKSSQASSFDKFSSTTTSKMENDEPDLEETSKPIENETLFIDVLLNTTVTSNIVETTTTNIIPFNSTYLKPKFVSSLSNFPNISKTYNKFKCKTILQTIDMKKRCDRKADCEDASDEQNCTCADYLKYKFPNTLCDGETNCLDMSDEQNCSVCMPEEYHCRQSNICINKIKQCDNVPDCPLHEDEADCFALTDGKIITLDEDFRPHINKSGIVTINHNGIWRVFCSNWTYTKANVAADICFYLGFNDYINFYTASLENAPLKVKHSFVFIDEATSTVDNKIEKCTGLFVKCVNKVDIKHKLPETNLTPLINVETPWNAEIYVEGVYKCTGTLLESEWVITSTSCFENNFAWHKKYVSVVLGNSKSYLNVRNPYEQVLRIVNFFNVATTDILLLQLERKINFSRYIRSIGFAEKNHVISETEVCLAQGSSSLNNTNLVYFKSVRNCTDERRCFKKEKHFLDNCHDNFNQARSWSGCIVCRSMHGWYPSAVYHELSGGCGFPQNVSYTSISYWKASILKLINKTYFKNEPPKCDGVRCTLGTCISNNNVCDGVVHCRDGADEENCLNIRNTCVSKTSCSCLKSEIRCKNGKCIPKSAFCDKNNDCGDWTDEPDVCNCSAYLNLTQSGKVCDGIRNCQDRSDEDPNVCKCRVNRFLCKRSQKCVSQDVICDGVNDCPDGEDEIECLSLIKIPESGLTEVQVRTAGFWHSGCFPKHLTTLQLEEICANIGYTGKSAKRLNPGSNTRQESNRIVLDVFTGIWIRPTTESKLLVAMRDGTQPFVQSRLDPTCYRLFLQCL